MDVVLEIPAAFEFLYFNKTIKGCWYGSSNVHEDVPKLLGLYSDGKLTLDELISREIERRGRQRGVRRDAVGRGRPLGHHLRVNTARAAHDHANAGRRAARSSCSTWPCACSASKGSTTRR